MRSSGCFKRPPDPRDISTNTQGDRASGRPVRVHQVADACTDYAWDTVCDVQASRGTARSEIPSASFNRLVINVPVCIRSGTGR